MPDKMDLSLDELIQQERRVTAASSLEKHLRSNTPLGPRGAVGKRHAGRGPAKSPSPAPGMSGRWAHDLHHKINPTASRVTKATPKSTPLPSNITPSVAASLSNNRLFTALHGALTPTPAPDSSVRANGGTPVDVGLSIRGAARQVPGLSIKGLAGPFVVRASNFAPGTTAEDVKTAMIPLGKILSCIIIAANPTVIAEIVFEKKEAAEKCIEQYNNQIADGRRLHLVLHHGPPIGKRHSANSSPTKSSSPSSSTDLSAAREEADRQRRLAHQQHMNGYVMDGSFGFKAPSLYSDPLVRRGRGFQQ